MSFKKHGESEIIGEPIKIKDKKDGRDDKTCSNEEEINKTNFNKKDKN